MRIGFDAKRLFLNNTGLGNYSRTLVSNLIKEYPNHEYFLYTTKKNTNKSTQFFVDHPQVTIVEPNNSMKGLWRSFGIVKQIEKDKLDIYHGLSNELPFGIQKLSVKKVVTIHDVIFRRYPKQYGFFDRQVYHKKTKAALKNADRIISISKQTTEDLDKFYQPNHDKIDLLYQTCHQTFTDSSITPVAKIGSYFLYVGSVIERKNLLRIVQAWSKIDPAIRTKLYIIGDGNAYAAKVKKFIEQHDLGKTIDWKKSVPNHELKALYQEATALIYPSTFEGFGIPVIEAMYSGRPVITSNLSSLKEAGGRAACLIDPFDVDALANAILKMNNLSIQQSYLDKIPKHLETFNPTNLTKQLMAIYEKDK